VSKQSLGLGLNLKPSLNDMPRPVALAARAARAARAASAAVLATATQGASTPSVATAAFALVGKCDTAFGGTSAEQRASTAARPEAKRCSFRIEGGHEAAWYTRHDLLVEWSRRGAEPMVADAAPNKAAAAAESDELHALSGAQSTDTSSERRASLPERRTEVDDDKLRAKESSSNDKVGEQGEEKSASEAVVARVDWACMVMDEGDSTGEGGEGRRAAGVTDATTRVCGRTSERRKELRPATKATQEARSHRTYRAPRQPYSSCPTPRSQRHSLRSARSSLFALSLA